MDIAQSFGSSSSYARKYALNGLLLIDDTNDPDVTNTHDKKQTFTNKGVIDIGDDKWADCLKYVSANKHLGFDVVVNALKKKYDFTPKALNEIKKQVK